MGKEWNTQRAFEKTLRAHLYRGALSVALLEDARARGISSYDAQSDELRDKLAALLRSNDVSVEELLARHDDQACDDGVCAYCGRRTSQLTRDHLWPKSKGGRGGDNFVWVCFPCNSDKQDMDFFTWIESDAGKSKPVPADVAKRYVLNAWQYCKERGLLDKQVKNAGKLPFDVRGIPEQLRID